MGKSRITVVAALLFDEWWGDILDRVIIFFPSEEMKEADQDKFQLLADYMQGLSVITTCKVEEVQTLADENTFVIIDEGDFWLLDLKMRPPA